ncbi:heme NO-binding domain-containing protein [Maribacter polysiphoniae]|uniref:Heme NO-binding domain-containing protein n=1 Tax=Maribacter polysiphoniae TaxID=429344 RepID=A0A316DYL3_9FLAO|nr:heme NO-binding domain-containing protein [Maribacter polysiphoniae]MBD1259665.1 heme NO-binding domain-containing protein [Maribacter polysiphoniae]PWK23194.1 heme-NO-binding protein [Maribacter polysiphoniae]
MKGIVFTEFLEMVESKFGLETVDNIIEQTNLSSEGVYTSVGTYDFNEMVSLITGLSDEVNIPVDDLIYTFGLYLFTGLANAHPEVIKSYNSPLGLLYSIEDHIHVHVKKLYPDAELPTFKILDKTDTSISMIYSSSRGLYRLAHGLIEKAFEHFNGSADITYELIKEDGTEVKFNITQNG